jgi:hypothetical protein
MISKYMYDKLYIYPTNVLQEEKQREIIKDNDEWYKVMVYINSNRFGKLQTHV